MRLLLEKPDGRPKCEVVIGPTLGSAADAPYLSNDNADGLGTLTTLLQHADLVEVVGVTGGEKITHPQ
jgi:hypothetical protein